MKKLSLLLMMTLFCVGLVSAQRTITGTIVDDTGEALIGATVQVKDYPDTGAASDIDGTYSIDVPDGGTVLVFSYVGYIDQEVEIGASNVVNVTMASDAQLIDEVVVTGVGKATSQKKVPFTVAKVNSEQLEKVPQLDAASAIQGKVAGVQITSGSGQPGSNSSIVIRGATSLQRGNAPLIIVDGVLTEGNLADIAAEDIESVEVVKGAAASSLYGSRANNGVINIRTKNGTTLGEGRSEIKIDQEYGASFLGFRPGKALAHRYEPDANGFPNAGAASPDGIIDNPWPVVFDHFDDALTANPFSKTTVSLASNGGKTTYYAAFQYQQNDGVYILTDGQQRRNFRLNLQHQVTDKLLFSTSNLHSASYINSNAASGEVLFNLYQMEAGADLFADNPDGEPYNIGPNYIQQLEANPIYFLANSVNQQNNLRFLGNYRLTYSPLDWLDLSGEYSVDRRNLEFINKEEKGFKDPDIASGRNLGQLSKTNQTRNAQTLSLVATMNKAFGDLGTTLRLQYMYEDNAFESINVNGTNLGVVGVTNLDNIASTNVNLSNGETDIIANNFSALLSLDYKDKYILDGLIRRDGVSLFGPENRWQTFYRVSAAYRVTEDININGIDEMKIRASYGVAGGRPNFNDQYNLFSLNAGNAGTPFQVFNPFLQSSTNKELEIGIDVAFLKRWNLTFNYARGNNEDQIISVPLSAANTAGSQVQNAGTLVSDVLELAVNGDIIRKPNLNWSFGIAADRIVTEITDLGRPDFQDPNGPGGVFRIENGQPFPILYGNRFATSLAEVQGIVGEGNDPAQTFVLNNQGYVVRRSEIGTANEQPVRAVDADGNIINESMGQVAPDFRIAFNTTLNIGKFQIYALVDWTQGGLIYNRTAQFGTRDEQHPITDQTGVSATEVKPGLYYNGFYNTNVANDFWVEDGTFVKLREASISYNFDSDFMKKAGIGVFSSARLSVVGRNLLTLTEYSGFDPEVGGSIYRYDDFTYPNFSNITGRLTLVF